MKRLYFYFCFIALLVLACAKEDALEPSGAQEDYFTVPGDATDPVSVLRREFHERTGVHLLFNDTLRHEQQGTNPDGSPYWFTETVDLKYFIVNSGLYDYSYEYLTDLDEMKTASQAAETYILPRLGEGTRPYSILLLRGITQDDGYGEEDVDYVNGLRCLALNLSGMDAMSQEEIEYYVTDLLYTMVYDEIDGLDYEDPTLDPFYAYCEDYYGNYYDEVTLPGEMDPENLTIEDMYTLGFLEEPDYYWGNFPYDNSDWKAYLNEIFYTDEAEFREMFADYPVVIAKYDILKGIVVDMGYNI